MKKYLLYSMLILAILTLFKLVNYNLLNLFFMYIYFLSITLIYENGQTIFKEIVASNLPNAQKLNFKQSMHLLAPFYLPVLALVLVELLIANDSLQLVSPLEAHIDLAFGLLLSILRPVISKILGKEL